MIDFLYNWAYIPALVIPFLIVFKIIFGKMFSNKIFYIFIILLSIYTIGALFVVNALVDVNLVSGIERPFFHKVNSLFCNVSVIYFSLYYKLAIIVFFIILFISLSNYLKSKDINILKRFFVSFVFIGVLFLFSVPTIIASPLKLGINDPIKSDLYYESDIDKYKSAVEFSILPSMKVYYSDIVALSTFFYLRDKYEDLVKVPDFSSKEAQSLINQYIKYSEYIAKNSDFHRYALISLFCLKTERFNEALKYSDLAKKYGISTTQLNASIYIAKGEYEKALASLDKTSKFWSTKEKLVTSYIGLGDFDNAIKILSEKKEKSDYLWKTQAKIFYYYKKGDVDKSKEIFEVYKNSSKKFSSYTYDEYIRYVDRIDY